LLCYASLLPAFAVVRFFWVRTAEKGANLSSVVQGQITLSGSGTTVGSDLVKVWNEDYAYVSSELSLSYSEANVSRAVSAFQEGKTDFALVTTLETESTVYSLPVAATGMAICYNVPGVKSSNLSLNRVTLTQLYTGNITQWNDSRLVALNPNLSLPNEEINFIFLKSSSGLNQVMIDGLTSFSPNFLGVLASVGGSFEDLSNLTKSKTESSVAAAISALQKQNYTLAYIPANFVVDYNLDFATIQNIDGN